MKTYESIMAQIEKLTKEAEKIRAIERKAVIVQVRAAIKTYGITPADLEAYTEAASRGTKAKRTAGKAPPEKEKTVRSHEIKYADENGNTWIGYGHHPQWIRDFLATGGDMKTIRVQPSTKGK